jgi:hypothetical protein
MDYLERFPFLVSIPGYTEADIAVEELNEALMERSFVNFYDKSGYMEEYTVYFLRDNVLYSGEITTGSWTVGEDVWHQISGEPLVNALNRFISRYGVTDKDFLVVVNRHSHSTLSTKSKNEITIYTQETEMSSN